MTTNNSHSSSIDRLITDLQEYDIAIKVEHGEGQAYYAWVDDQLHHHREHPTAQSCDPGEEARERLQLDSKYFGVLKADIIPFDSSPFSRDQETEDQHT